MKALIVIDAQNEFSPKGKRPVQGHAAIIEAIRKKVNKARSEGLFIAWIRHFNLPDESPAFVPGTWGAELTEGFGPLKGSVKEIEFAKDVYGAFTGTQIGQWLELRNIKDVDIMGFYTHGCVSTTSREAIMAGLNVYIDIQTTGTCDIEHELLGIQKADEVKRSTLLQLFNMGAVIYSEPGTENNINEIAGLNESFSGN
jgi:nicotinamidase-related amidase